MSEDFTDLKKSMEWGATLDLTPEQRSELKDLCCKIAGIPTDAIPSWRLSEEAEAKRKALQRVKELEAMLEATSTSWWRWS